MLPSQWFRPSAIIKKIRMGELKAQQENVRSLSDKSKNIEQEFLSFSIKVKDFFALKDIEYATDIDGSLSKLIASTDALKTTKGGEKLDFEINAIINNGYLLGGLFSKLVEQQKRAGFTNEFGYYKIFEQTAMNFEIELNQLNASKDLHSLLVEMRRFEAVHLNHTDKKSYDKVAALKKLISTQLTLENIKPDVKKQLDKQLKTYFKAFKFYSKLTSKIEKIRQEFDLSFNKLTPKFTALRTATQEQLNIVTAQGIRIEAQLTQIMIIGISVIMIIIIGFGLMISRSISKPLSLIVNLMDRSSKGETGLKILAKSQQDEIGELARALEVFDMKNIEMNSLKQNEEAIRNKNAKSRCDELVSIATNLENQVQSVVSNVSQQSHNMGDEANRLDSVIETLQSHTKNADVNAKNVSDQINMIAAASEELSYSFSEVSKQVERSNSICETAVIQSNETNITVRSLSDSADAIGNVIKLISDIAEQTNLLALNATIEAARAGDAGKGFAVVASEVKNLANQTANATNEISAQINTIQQVTSTTVTAIENIGKTVRDMGNITNEIHAAITQQSLATNEISKNVQQASTSTEEFAGILNSVTEQTHTVDDISNNVSSETNKTNIQVVNLEERITEVIKSLHESAAVSA